MALWRWEKGPKRGQKELRKTSERAPERVQKELRKTSERLQKEFRKSSATQPPQLIETKAIMVAAMAATVDATAAMAATMATTANARSVLLIGRLSLQNRR